MTQIFMILLRSLCSLSFLISRKDREDCRGLASLDERNIFFKEH